MPELEQTILSYIQRPGYKPQRPDGLARKLALTKKELPAFRAALESLLVSGQIAVGSRDLIRHRSSDGGVAGILKRTSSGAAYVIPHEKAGEERGPSRDIYIDARDVGDAQTGDEVLVQLLSRRKAEGQRCGRVAEVLERASTTFVGTYYESDGQSLVQIDGRNFAEPVVVDDPGVKGPRNGDKVVIDMLRFPTHHAAGEAVLVKVLGKRGQPGVDTQSIIYEFGLPDEFPEAAVDEARFTAQQFDETDLSDRLDLTGETIITIDPVDARDFDDAISLERTERGHWRLGVHIADVATFVPSGGPLDLAARERGTSVYLPDRVIPMLPEIISNGLASLQQGKVRYTKSVFIEFAADGVPIHTEFANSAIRVTKRFAYEEVMPLLRDSSRGEGKIAPEVMSLLKRMHELAMMLRRRRYTAGALELTLAEVKLDLDDENRVVGAHDVEHDESHQIIEEFMLAANIAVAQKLTDLGVPFLRRVHRDPAEMKLRKLAEFANALGYRVKQFQSRFDMQKLLEQVQGKPEQTAVNFAMLRSMKQADYSGEELGHYALAVDNYCHFTSPIRRYPDLTVHRLIDEMIRRGGRPSGLSELEVAKVGRHCSMTERRAADAERELVKVKLLTFLKGRIGDELDAVITGVESFGLFCQGIELPVDGLIHIAALDPGEYFEHDPDTYTLIGRRSGKKYRLGDKVRVVIAHVDVERRQLDFRMALPAGAKRRDSEDGRSSKAKAPYGRSRGSARRERMYGSRGESPDRRDHGQRADREPALSPDDGGEWWKEPTDRPDQPVSAGGARRGRPRPGGKKKAKLKAARKGKKKSTRKKK
ncbi:MAG: ribonuclease R [Planctomycetaceae bacterium]|nr:ribonuclease R [Planctomycetaceae bacterium]